MSLKDRISSPLEAGTSILDAHHLPPHLAPALEHVSSRLARKSQHITLVVARRDYQLPSVVPPKGLLTPTTPSPLLFGIPSIDGLAAKCDILAWPGSSTRSIQPPAQVASLTLDTLVTTPHDTLYRLVDHHRHDELYDVRIVGFCSIIQNEVLFCSEGLTILSLDRLYSLKSALSSYSKTKSHLRLEDAVDELRRIILATNGAKVSKTAILRSYDWLSVSSSALVDLDRMYRRAYGGPEQYGGISGLTSFAEPAIQPISDSQERYKEDEVEESTIAVAVMKGKTPSPKPLLKLQTNFTPGPILKPKPKRPEASAQVPVQVQVEEEEEEDGDRTARPTDQLYFSIQKWEPPSTIDQVLTAGPINRSAFSPLTPTPIMSPGSTRFGPLTPHDYEDISPTTRGEWGFMLADNAFQSGRKVGVETF
ncbi:uncharacterized protein QYS62_003648 [Fusarium acuminatum]|uniref:DUF7582 domain-containing protein n=1 Tax=Fusarium acuminatum TaxID=5515 RepID=A0ABZ2WRS7_9HYPO